MTNGKSGRMMVTLQDDELFGADVESQATAVLCFVGGGSSPDVAEFDPTEEQPEDEELSII